MAQDKVGVIFMDQPKTKTSKEGKEYSYYEGTADDGSKLIAYRNTSKSGKMYLSIVKLPKRAEGDYKPRPSNYAAVETSFGVQPTYTSPAQQLIDPSDLPF